MSTVDPLLSTDNLVMMRDTGPSRPAINEFNALFNRDQVRWQIDGIAGSRDTLGDQMVVSALMGNFSYTLGQLHYETDGFVENDAAEKDIYDLLIHGQVATNLSVQVDAKRSELSIGQTLFAFDEFPVPITIKERSDTFRFSGHYVLDSGGDWIWSAVVEERKGSVEELPGGRPVHGIGSHTVRCGGAAADQLWDSSGRHGPGLHRGR